jgi:hypothetical protein
MPKYYHVHRSTKRSDLEKQFEKSYIFVSGFCYACNL